MTACTAGARRGCAGRLLALSLALSLALTGAVPSPATGQQPAPPAQVGGWSQGTDVRIQAPPAPGPRAAPATPGGSPANTTVVPRGGGNGDARGQTQLTLTAALIEEGQAIESGLVWRIFRERNPGDNQPRLVSEHKEAAPVLRLDPGEYLVNVAFGRAHLTRKVAVRAGQAVSERFVLNAGGLRISVQLASGEQPTDRQITYDILSDERDQFGERTKIMTNARPGLVIRLNAGIYQIVSTYGDANAVVRADVAVEPGKLTDATVVHSAARVTFKLVTRPGGEALAEAQWQVVGANGETVKDSAGALPTHVLAAGTYVVNARYGGQVFSRQFTVRAGDVAEVEVVTR